MKCKSIQESLLEEILAIQEPILQRDPKQLYPHKSGLYASDVKNANNGFASSFVDIEEEILRMRISATRMLSKDKNNSQEATAHTRTKVRNMKTEASQDQVVPPMNYSTIYTRRSSLDESLYDKAVREESARKFWITRKKKQQQYQQQKQCSHKPQINKTSKQIMSKLNKQQLYQKIRRKKQQSIKRIIDDEDKKQMKECSFTPNLQHVKNKIAKSVKVQHFTIEEDGTKYPERHSVTIFDHLYADSVHREIKNKKRQQNHIMQGTKRPEIDSISKHITKDTNFETRMLQYQKKKLQKYLQQKQKQNRHLRQSYRPTINNSTTSRNKQLSIGEYLYLQSKRQKNKTKQTKNINNIEVGQQKNQRSTNVNKKSTQVYQQRKIMVFYQIFKLLDGDQDGVISVSNLTLNNLPHEVIKIIYPLVQELELMEVELHEQEFISSISNLFKTLTVHQRDILLGFIGNSNNKQQANESFKPKINLKSKIIASCNQRSQMNIYDYCSIRQAERERQLEQEREDKHKRQLEMCTFQPRIINKFKY